MGIWAESAKTLMFNNSMLRGKTLFKVIGENATSKKYKTKIDPLRINFGRSLFKKRKNSRSFVFFLITYPFILLFFYIWILVLLK